MPSIFVSRGKNAIRRADGKLPLDNTNTLYNLPISTPTALGQIYFSEAKTVPIVTPFPKCTSGIALT